MKQFIRCSGCGLRVRLAAEETPYWCACGRLVSADGKTVKHGAARPKPRGPCAHLGAEFRREPCTGCKGKRTELKVFACAIHVECTLGKQLEGLACCATCPDYEPQLTPPAAGPGDATRA